jgi:hypothetical protein
MDSDFYIGLNFVVVTTSYKLVVAGELVTKSFTPIIFYTSSNFSTSFFNCGKFLEIIPQIRISSTLS